MPEESEIEQVAIISGPYKEYPRNICIQDLVARQAQATPDAVAIVAGNQTLRYRELNCRADQFAHRLQSLGVRPGTLVAICMERSVDLIVGLLAILKAGGAYVPLDPEYPDERLSFMLQDAQPLVLVTQRHLLHHLSMESMHVIYLDSNETLLRQEGEKVPLPAATSEDLAYVIYTSGSTGRPKGTQITHSNLLNLVFWHQRAFSLKATDRATQIASPAFDAIGWELWPYLITGASVHFINEEIRATPVLLRDWLVNERITITFLPTALAESVLVLPWPATTPLRFLLTGADTLRRYPSPMLPFALINNYGPTETTVVATFGQVHPTEQTGILPAIGRPIDNAHIYILDEQRHPVRPGTPGELYIGGAGVGRGYLNRPELTEQKFLPDPFRNQHGALMYRTGDLASLRSDGQIDFLGRLDHQIKIRGFRIEPNEITALLNERQDVQSSFVIAREDTPGDKRLVAYIVPVEPTRLTASSLRGTLMTHLPDYMIPAAFVVLEALPVTSNGKIDRAALPIPDASNTVRDEVIAAYNTATEEYVAEIMAPLLGLEQIGVDENFFMLGGHSLLGAQVIARVTEVFGVDLALRSLFESPTVRQLSSEIEQLIMAKLEMMSDEEAQRLLA